MEDTVINKDHYMYMFRLHIEDNNEDKLKDWFTRYSISHWIGKHELGAKTGAPHYQMAIWTPIIKTPKQIVAMRKYWTDKLGKGTCAITSAKKIKSLCSYSSKSDGKLITNLSTQKINKIPDWKNEEQKKTTWKDKLDKYLKTEVPAVLKFNKRQYAITIMNFYKKHNKRPQRSQIQYLLWRDGSMSSEELLQDWKLIDRYEPYKTQEELHTQVYKDIYEEEINHKV